jgi:hypothetical protein
MRVEERDNSIKPCGREADIVVCEREKRCGRGVHGQVSRARQTHFVHPEVEDTVEPLELVSGPSGRALVDYGRIAPGRQPAKARDQETFDDLRPIPCGDA